MKLGVNIDHIAVLREARGINQPDPLDAVSICNLAGADQITIHLREDRRHIHDDDARAIIANSKIPVNLECSLSEEIIEKVIELAPHRATIVPEKREEKTTEGGLDIKANFERIYYTARKLRMSGIEVSLFIDPETELLGQLKSAEIDFVELHTGTYANLSEMLYSNLSRTKNRIESLEYPRHKLAKMLHAELAKIADFSAQAKEYGIRVAAGHGLNYHNVKAIRAIEGIEELNIGQSIIARSIFVGLDNAIKEMITLIR